MLINNALSGVALALNAMIDHLYNQKEQVWSPGRIITVLAWDAECHKHEKKS